MSQESGISTYNPHETYMGPMVVEYQQPVVDMALFIDTPLNLNIQEESFCYVDKSSEERTCISIKDKLFVLKRPIEAKSALENGIWHMTNEYLEISAWGESYDKVMEAFCFTFYSIYKNFGTEDDNNLSPQGIELKNKINGLILFFNES